MGRGERGGGNKIDWTSVDRICRRNMIKRDETQTFDPCHNLGHSLAADPCQHPAVGHRDHDQGRGLCPGLERSHNLGGRNLASMSKKLFFFVDDGGAKYVSIEIFLKVVT